MICRRASEDEPLDAIRRLDRERHPDHASERDAADRDAVEPQLVEEALQAVRERFDSATPARGARTRRGQGGRT